jgi:hypothetical protein
VENHDIKMDLKKIGHEGAKWVRLTQDRVQFWVLGNTVMELQVP